MKFFLLAAAWLLAAANVQAKASVPALARIAGVRVGVNTTEDVERRYGPGQPTLGGHPRSGRMWYCPAAKCTLYLDGFNHDNRGEHVIDTVLIESASEDGDLPRINLPMSQLRLLGVTALGMTHTQAQRAATLHIKGNNLVREANGHTSFDHGHYKVEHWQAELRFSGDTLYAIFLGAD